MSFIVVMSARRRGVGQQRHLTAVLHGRRDVPLVLAAVAADAAGTDLAAVGDELPQQGRVLVVDVGRLVLAELADLLLGLANRGLGHRSSPGSSGRWIRKGDQKGGSSDGPAGVDQGSLAPPPPPPKPPPPPPPPKPPPPSPREARVTLAVA